MSLHPHVITPVPAETARVARAAFPKGHPYLTFRDALGTIFQGEDFTALFPAWGPPDFLPFVNPNSSNLYPICTTGSRRIRLAS
jgi:hypothetical protein